MKWSTSWSISLLGFTTLSLWGSLLGGLLSDLLWGGFLGDLLWCGFLWCGFLGYNIKEGNVIMICCQRIINFKLAPRKLLNHLQKNSFLMNQEWILCSWYSNKGAIMWKGWLSYHVSAWASGPSGHPPFWPLAHQWLVDAQTVKCEYLPFGIW